MIKKDMKKKWKYIKRKKNNYEKIFLKVKYCVFNL